MNPPQPRRLAWLSPWMIIGSVGILAAALLIAASRNLARDREVMTNALVSQALAIARSIEAGSRTGMGMGMGMGPGRAYLQRLLEETAQQPGVLSVALADESGVIVAHSTRSEVGKKTALPAPGEPPYRFVSGEEPAFELIRPYQPWQRPRHDAQPRAGAWGAGPRQQRQIERPPPPPEAASDRDLFLIVALDAEPFDAAIQSARRQTALLMGVLLLGGAAGFVSLVFAQHTRSARRSLRDQQAFTETVVSSMPVGMLATDATGRIVSANEAARRILGPGAAPGAAIGAFPALSALLPRIAQEGAIAGEEVRHTLSDGGSVPLLVDAATLRDGAGNSTGSALIFSDLSRVRHLEAELRRSERLASLGRLAAGIAHEIRNPLSSIKGFAAILAAKTGGDPEAEEIARVMEGEVTRLNRVITELLDFARPTDLAIETVSCRDLLARASRLIEADAKNLGVAVEQSAEPVDLTARLDPDRFAQVLLNLALNALQAMPNGGRLTLAARAEPGALLFTVSDTGSGIAPDHLPHIFDPYFTTRPQGVGLGLAIVHKIVEAHGGVIEAESAPGHGATFTVRLPAAA